MRYSCLILDHDDTVVNSTATIHYPAFAAYMKRYHGGTDITLDEYFAGNFDPGVVPYFTDIVGMTKEELPREESFWKEFVKDHIPASYPGIRELLWRFQAAGGSLFVASHSFDFYIQRDYDANGLPKPERIFGWELPKEHRKPSPYAIETIERDYHIPRSEMLVVDDLKPGFEMARLAGVDFAAAGWANDIPSIESFMRAHSDYYFKTVDAFSAFLGI